MEDNKSLCGDHSARIENLEKTNEQVWEAIDKLRESIDKLRNRAPNWCTVVISLLALILGYAIRGLQG